MAKLEAAVREELEKAIAGGFTAEEVENARKGMPQGAAQERSQDNYLAQRWAGLRYLDRDRKAINPSRLAVFIAADSAKAAAGGAP